ncbi:DHH family phosphoesterase [Humisphaera borealis]|uniref:DHH family phosphoesterase n=1 Tax=Humisphaera borealis TaxID=2807512 RepID=A0A7M2X0B6_9BACT|nr:DHH family phosphoesterase [Humisphaera borealis]QOV90531.1 DHH family phosphoesterase [Humisphaera borealis]
MQTLAGSASAAERRSRARPRAGKFLRVLATRRNILVTTHIHPDPDALGSAVALAYLLSKCLGMTQDRPSITLAAKGRIGGGINDAFLRVANGKLKNWEEIDPASFDAIVMVDTQPQFSSSPLPPGLLPTVVIDHHRGRGRKSKLPLWDVRPEVGATCSIIFSYFMDLEQSIPADLAAAMLYAIETDLAGAAGTPGDLDNIALSSLTLSADPRKLYQMRFTPLPQAYFRAYAQALGNAEFQGNALMSHLDNIESMEQPAIMADMLLRFDQAEWALVTAETDNGVVLSLRTRAKERSAADVMHKIIARLGEGGGHRTKAGGFIRFAPEVPHNPKKLRAKLWRRLLSAVGVRSGKPIRLVA